MIDSYLRDLGRELGAAGVGGACSRRFLQEAREHLLESAAEHGEDGAVAAFGPARPLAAVVAAELATARTRRAAYSAFIALAPVGLVYAILFLTFPSAGTVQGSGLGVLSLAGAVFFPQLAFVCGVLAVLRVVRRSGATALPAADLAVVRRRTAFALAGGALTLASLGAFALDQHSAISTWWLAGSLASLGVFAPVLAAVGAATVRAGRPMAAAGEVTDTVVEDIGALLVRVPVLREIRLPAEPRRFAFLVAGGAALAVGVAGIAQHDPLDGLVRAAAEGVAVLVCYRLFGRQLGLRR